MVLQEEAKFLKASWFNVLDEVEEEENSVDIALKALQNKMKWIDYSGKFHPPLLHTLWIVHAAHYRGLLAN